MAVCEISADLPTIKNLTTLANNGVKIFSCPPAYKMISAKTDIQTKPMAAELILRPVLQQYNTLVAKVAYWSEGEFLTFNSSVQNLLIP